MLETRHTWTTFSGIDHTTTVTLPEAFRPLAKCLRAALMAHVRFQRHVSGDIDQTLARYSLANGSRGSKDGSCDAGLSMVGYRAAAQLDQRLAAVIVDLWRHCYGDTPVSDSVRPSKYVLRLARQISTTDRP